MRGEKRREKEREERREKREVVGALEGLKKRGNRLPKLQNEGQRPLRPPQNVLWTPKGPLGTFLGCFSEAPRALLGAPLSLWDAFWGALGVPGSAFWDDFPGPRVRLKRERRKP